MTSSEFRQDGMFGGGKWLLWACGSVAIAILAFRFPELMSGVLPGLDDMMRLQQVRDLLNGQAWFDVDQARLLTPESGEMHWSRLPDLFLAGFIFLAEPLFGQTTAEALAAGIWPFILFAAIIALLCMIMSRLGANIAGQLCGLVFFAGSAAIYNFWPGRIDHHGLVAVLVLMGVAALVSRQITARSGWILALCICASLTIALEALPYAVGLIAIAGLFWIVRGHQEGVRLATFGAALAIFSTAFLVLDAPGLSPRRWVCDAYSISHWAALSFGGVLLVGLGVFGGWFDTWQKRLIAGGVCAGLTFAMFVWVNPACLGDPYAAVPDTVRDSWLDNVDEAQSLPQLLNKEMDRVIWVYGFLFTASLATLWMIAKAAPGQRLPRIGCALLLALAIAATVWQLRGQSFSHLFAVIGAGWLAGSLFERWSAKRGVGPLLVFAIAAALLSPSVWRALGDNFQPAPGVLAQADSLSSECIRPDQFVDLAQMPKMRVHTPIDLGVPILLRTPHEVFVAPYHRNVLGIDRANSVLIGAPDQARRKLLDMGATHLAYCRRLGVTDIYGARWPDSFAAQLNRDALPEWLEPADALTETEGVVRLYRVTPE